VGLVERSPLEKLYKSTSSEVIKQTFEAALKGIREEFDEHLESINDNTNEIEANYEILKRVENKVDRVEEHLEQLHLAVSKLVDTSSEPTKEKNIDLDEREKDVFLILYTSSDRKPLTYKQIASALKESEFLARGYITNMIEKGVPISKRYLNDKAYVSLDSEFKEKQAKQNIVRLSQKTVAEFAV
jgi:predicted transcriptional regulator/exonuclease VII small subunit